MGGDHGLVLLAHRCRPNSRTSARSRGELDRPFPPTRARPMGSKSIANGRSTREELRSRCTHGPGAGSSKNRLRAHASSDLRHGRVIPNQNVARDLPQDGRGRSSHHAAELIEGEPIPEVELDGRLVVVVVADLQSRVHDLAGEILDVILEAGEHLGENCALTLEGWAVATVRSSCLLIRLIGTTLKLA